MTRKLKQYNDLIKITIWIERGDWNKLGDLVGEGERSQILRDYVERYVGKEKPKKRVANGKNVRSSVNA
jgi:hypothetical protein